MRVQSVHVYPVKATAGWSTASVPVTPAGLRYDRRWAVVTAAGHRLNASTHHRLLQVTARPDDDGALTLCCDGDRPLTVPEPRGGPRVTTDITRLAYALDGGDEAAAWFSEVLRQPVRLVWQDDPATRTISTAHGGLGDEPLNLADTAPILLTVTSSLDQLDQWVAAGEGPVPVLMERFRANVVVERDELPFEEDDWRRVRIGAVSYRFAEHCDRCNVTLIDPKTLRRRKEPIRTLARHRRWSNKTWFGVRLVPLAAGTVSVGDPVVVEHKAP